VLTAIPSNPTVDSDSEGDDGDDDDQILRGKKAREGKDQERRVERVDEHRGDEVGCRQWPMNNGAQGWNGRVVKKEGGEPHLMGQFAQAGRGVLGLRQQVQYGDSVPSIPLLKASCRTTSRLFGGEDHRQKQTAT